MCTVGVGVALNFTKGYYVSYGVYDKRARSMYEV